MWIKETIEFFANNFENILKILGVLFAPSLIFNIFQDIKSKKFKKFHNEKELEIKEAELITEKASYQNWLQSNQFYTGNDWRQKEIDHNLKVFRLESEIYFLKKVLNKKEK